MTTDTTEAPALLIGDATFRTFTFEGKSFVIQHHPEEGSSRRSPICVKSTGAASLLRCFRNWTNRSDLKMSSPLMVSIQAMRWSIWTTRPW